MATRRPTFAKRERDRAKKAKAAAKRERRQERKAENGDDDGLDGTGPVDESAILARLEELHRQFDDEQIGFEDFEEERDRLIAQLTAGS